MTEREKKYLSDVLTAIERIEAFSADVRSFENYVQDLKTKSAVERQLAIVGEAVNKFLKEPGKNSLQNASRIVSLRNRIIHGYDNLDDAIIWAVITQYIKPLREEVTNLLVAEQAG
jgi:uncharacterized protein with HEPN domain